MQLVLSDAEQDLVFAVNEGLIFEQPAQIRAEVIRALMLGLSFSEQGKPTPTPCGVRVSGATIIGTIDLNNGRGHPEPVMPGLVLERCFIPDGIDISYAYIGKLSLEHSRLSWLRAIRTVFRGEVIAKDIGPISEDTHSLCYLDFRGAWIEGDLLLNRSVLREPEAGDIESRRQYALSLRNAFVNGTVYFRLVRCFGTVNLSMAEIECNFTARGAQILPAAGRESLLAEDVVIKGGLLLRWVKLTSQPFIAHGRINLKRAKLGGAVFDRAVIDEGQPIQNAFLDDVTHSVEMEDAVIGGGLYFREGFRLEGSLGLANVSVRTDIDATGAYFSKGIFAPAANVASAFKLDNVTVGADVWTDLSDAHIGTVLSVKCLKSHLDLRRAMTKTFDDACSLGKGMQLRLDGFLYERLETVGGHDTLFAPTRRLDWLARQEGYQFNQDPFSTAIYFATSLARLKTKRENYRPQPFIQLGKVLEAHGYENDARKIWRITEWIEWKNEGRWPVKFVMWLFGTFFGFGYSPGRALVAAGIFYGLGLFGYEVARHNELIVYDPLPVTSTLSAEGHLAMATDAEKFPSEVACRLDPWVYTADVMVPFIDLHKSEKCDIREDFRILPVIVDVGAWAPYRWVRALTPDMQWPIPVAQIWNVNIASLGRLLRTLYALVGWLVISLTVLTLSGLLRQKKRDS